MAIIDTSKAIAELIKKGATIEAQEQIMQLREEALELQEENLKLKTENVELKKKEELQEKVKYKRRVYYRKGDEVPFCPYCYEKHQLLIHLTSYDVRDAKEQHPRCQECTIQYRVVGGRDFTFFGRPPKRK